MVSSLSAKSESIASAYVRYILYPCGWDAAIRNTQKTRVSEPKF